MKRINLSSSNFLSSLKRFVMLFISKTHILILAFACVWMIFFDRYNLMSQYSMRQQIEELEQDKAYYVKNIERVDYEYEQLFNDPEALEKYAREKYYMKKADEDVFVVAR